jgi:photosystem II stability/assembly factor-like uncharacterized protein
MLLSLIQSIMKRKFVFIAAIFTFSFITSQNAKAQWVPMGLQEYDPSSVAGSASYVLVGTSPDGASILFSSDNGADWMSSPDGLNDITAVGICGTNLLVSLNPGVLISSDNGKNWESYDYGLENTGVLAFEVNGTNIFAGTDNGVFLLEDSDIAENHSWTQPDRGAMSRPINSFAESGTNLFAGGYGIFLSTDSGRNWIDKTNGLEDSSINALAAIGTNIFVATDSGIFHSTDSGTHWNLSDSGLAPYSPISYVFSLVACGNNIFAAVEGSVYLSIDTGASWAPVYIGLGGGVSILAANSAYIFAVGNDVWRRPISDFTNSAVSPIASIQNSLTTYPNPFPQSTTITLTTPASGVVELSVVNLLGEEVAHIFDGELGVGEHSFSWNASGLPIGTYFGVVRMNGLTQELPMILSR